MPFSFFKRKDKKEVILVIDIGSGTVAASLVEFSKLEIPKILYVKRVPLGFLKELSGKRFKEAMTKALDLAIVDIQKTGLKYMEGNRIERVFCSLASPWFISQTKTIKIKKEKPFTVSLSFLSEVLKKEEEEFENSNKKVHSEVIERKMINIKLNGYKTDNPINKKINEIEFNIFFSMAQSSVLDEIEGIIAKHFHVDEIIFHSFTLIAFSAVRDMYERVSDFLLLDITGEVTDVSLIKDASIVKTMSFPVGKNTVLRSLSKELKTSPEEVLSSLKLLYSKSLFGNKRDKLRKSVALAGDEWLKAFRESVVSLSDTSSLPSTIFFTSDDDLSVFYSKIMQSEEFTQSSMTSGLFVLRFINSYSLDSYIKFRTNAQKDPFIALGSIFFNRLFELE